MRKRSFFPKIKTAAKLIVVTALIATTLGLISCAIKFIVMPGYKDPSSRMYTSRFGYANLVRQTDGSFPVSTAHAAMREIDSAYLGEGLIQSEPVQVPVIPVGRISHVYVKEGDTVKKGQLLAELDTTLAELALEEARIKLAAVESELERTKIGTHYQHSQERPVHNAIRLKAAAYEVAARKELGKMLEKLADQKLVAQTDLIKNKIQRVEAQANMREAQLALDMAEQGHKHSLQIAHAAIRSAAIDVEQAEQTLREHKIFAPADGIVERCVVHVGEYAQTSGKPAFLLASGRWFEAHFDQSSIGRIAVGDRAKISLEAFAGQVFSGKVTQVRSIISYSSGGPESNRPLRPLGTGAPEWPATYSVRIAIEDDLKLIPGLTGFARAISSKQTIAVPSSAIIGVSGSKGLVYVVADEHFEPREVTVGQKSKGWTEIRSGLPLGEEVIIAGHHVLELGDRIAIEQSVIIPEKIDSQLAEK